eukprot:1158749-Pelagomonas_calceolata.AAC.5
MMRQNASSSITYSSYMKKANAILVCSAIGRRQGYGCVFSCIKKQVLIALCYPCLLSHRKEVNTYVRSSLASWEPDAKSSESRADLLKLSDADLKWLLGIDLSTAFINPCLVSFFCPRPGAQSMACFAIIPFFLDYDINHPAQVSHQAIFLHGALLQLESIKLVEKLTTILSGDHPAPPKN